MKGCVFTISILLILSSGIVNTQNISLEVGMSRHFMPQTEKYDHQPNLHIQFHHNVSALLEYSLSYYCIRGYWPFEFHEFNSWTTGPEISSRTIYGADLSLNILPLLRQKKSMVGFNIGPSFRYRNEKWWYSCHYTSQGWTECLGYGEIIKEFGINCMLDYNYFIWDNLGLSLSSIVRVYEPNTPSLSFNAAVMYKFNY